MKSQDCKRLLTRRQICPRCQGGTPRWPAITNTNAWAPALFWLDLLNGHVTARVERRHRSREFIALLKDLDDYYAPDWTIRLILDNHSAHLSKETQAFLATRPNRFKYVLTPTHGSWLNIIETLFGKMARTFPTAHPGPVLGRAPA